MMFSCPHIVIVIPRTTRCVKTRSPKPESPTALNCLRPAFRTIVQDCVAGRKELGYDFSVQLEQLFGFLT